MMPERPPGVPEVAETCSHDNVLAPCEACRPDSAEIPRTETANETGPRFDVSVFEDAREALDQLVGASGTLIERLEQTTIDAETVEGGVQRIAMLLTTTEAMRQHIVELVQRLREHPLALHPQVGHPLLDAYGQAPERVLRSLRESVPRLREAQSALAAAEATLTLAQDGEQQRTQAVNEERDRLRVEAEGHVRQGNTLLGFGFLPKTRRERRRAFEEANGTIAVLNAIGALGPETVAVQSQEVITRAPWDVRNRFEDLLQKYRAMEAQHYVTVDAARALHGATSAHATAVDSVRKRLRDGLGQLDLEEAAGALNAYRDDIAAALADIERFDRFLEREVFTVLQITAEDERRARAESLPEDAPDVLREARERSFENIREMTASFFAYFQRRGKQPEALLATIRARAESVRQSAFVGFNDCARDVLEVLSAGEIKPAFLLPPEHRGRSTTGGPESSDIEMRKRVERALGFQAGEHPTYLALGTNRDRARGSAPHYGAFHFSFPLETFRERMVCTVGDSLNWFGVPFSLRGQQSWERGTYEEQARRRQLTLDHGLLAKALFEIDEEYEPKRGMVTNFVKGMHYVEVQVLGPVRVHDAEALALSRPDAIMEINTLASDFSSAAHLTERVMAMQPNLPFHITGEPPPDFAQHYRYHTYARFFQP